MTKWPRFTFEKFRQTSPELTVQMKSVGEAMAIGRSFRESLQKAIRSLEIDRYSLDARHYQARPEQRQTQRTAAEELLGQAVVCGRGVPAKLHDRADFELTKIDPWFLEHIREIVAMEQTLKKMTLAKMTPATTRQFKENGFSDKYMAQQLGVSEAEFRTHRLKQGVTSVFKRVDTCGAGLSDDAVFVFDL